MLEEERVYEYTDDEFKNAYISDRMILDKQNSNSYIHGREGEIF